MGEELEQELYPQYCKHKQPIWYTQFCIGCRAEKDIIKQRLYDEYYSKKYRHFNANYFFGSKHDPDDDEDSDVDDDFKVLGLKKTASEEDLKKAFHQKARETHPDKVGGDGDTFKKIRMAYERIIECFQ